MLGRLLLLSVAFAAFAAAPVDAQDTATGAALFQSACGVCHALDGHAKIGPSLGGVVGRKAGSAPGFHYSAAMKAYGQVWTPATLDAFLAAPAKAVPGTNMSAAGVKDAAKRADLIAFLKTKK